VCPILQMGTLRHGKLHSRLRLCCLRLGREGYSLAQYPDSLTPPYPANQRAPLYHAHGLSSLPLPHFKKGIQLLCPQSRTLGAATHTHTCRAGKQWATCLLPITWSLSF
jgi:hypothetical protein